MPRLMALPASVIASLCLCLQAAGTFPDSGKPFQPQQQQVAKSGQQLEAQRTAVPASPEDSNAAASQSPAGFLAPASTDKPAGKQLEAAQNAISWILTSPMLQHLR